MNLSYYSLEFLAQLAECWRSIVDDKRPVPRRVAPLVARCKEVGELRLEQIAAELERRGVPVVGL